jgi:hypothetical protein
MEAQAFATTKAAEGPNKISAGTLNPFIPKQVVASRAD